MSELVVRPVTRADRDAVDRFLASNWADFVARRGELVDARRAEALLAEADGKLAGVATLVQHGNELEVLTLHAVEPWHGAGTALLDESIAVARSRGCRRLWLITTNDNLDALRFYQRRGLRLVKVDAAAVDRSRASLKPGIAEVGLYGIPIRDELELEVEVGPT
jgi:GNAT superfamily N-acetyltransferase